MRKIAIVTDNNSGYTIDEAKAEGIYLVQMPFYIDGEEYLEGVNLNIDQFFEFLQNGADVSTSQPSPEGILNLWDELLKEYDEIIHIPMSSGLSGSCQTAMMLAQDYEGKVFVVDNQRISITLKRSVQDAKALMAMGKTAEEIRDYLLDTKLESSIYVTVATLKYLKKGGRITPAAAALGTLLKIKPVLQIQGEKLDSFAKARTMGQAKNMMIEAVKKDIEERFGGIENVHIDVAHTQNYEAAMELRDQLHEIFPECDASLVDPLSLSVSCHIGEGALAIACTKKLAV
ncbi:MAG: DegV family protein [Lachnospiraceae bacterium]